MRACVSCVQCALSCRSPARTFSSCAPAPRVTGLATTEQTGLQNRPDREPEAARGQEEQSVYAPLFFCRLVLQLRERSVRVLCSISTMCTFCRSCLHSILFPSSSYRTARRKRRSSAAAQQVFGLHKQNHVGRHDWLEVGLCECWSSVLVFPASGSLVVCVLLPSPTPAVFPQASGLRVLLLLLSVRPHSVSLFYSPPALLLSVLRFSRACTPRFVVFRCAALLFLFAALLPSARCPLLPPRSLFFLALLTRRSSLTIPSPNLTLLIAGSIHNAYEPRSRST